MASRPRRRGSDLWLGIGVAVVMSGAGSATRVEAQETLERSTNVSGGWIGTTGMLYLNVPFRFTTADGGITGSPTFEVGLGMPRNSLVGARFAYQSPTVPGRPDEWELFARHQPLVQARGAPLDVGLGAGFNGAAESVEGELSLARWVGPLRLLGAARAMSSPYGGDDSRAALAGGAVIHPLRGRAPIALSADLATLLDREDDERAAWSVGLQVGASYTTHTLALFATNTSTSTLEGLSRGGNRVRYGFEITVPVPAGRFVGWYANRETAMKTVVTTPDRVQTIVRAESRDYLFFPATIEIAAGTTIEWTNRDRVVHTVSADDGTWDSGAISQGQSWRARFDRPGRYPFHCGPHPFMKGLVIVR